jgi:catechol 2,3-dioxygenase-like lactoylglutathione lyase family enzyme
MPVQLTKDSIDLGIVITDVEASLAFYRDTLGLESVGDSPMPGGSHMYRLMCGSSMIKLVKHAAEPKAVAPPGGIAGATGYRYWTISVSNIAEVVAACEAGGYTMVWPVTELRPGIVIAMVEDPDGNWVEFLATSV